MGRFSELAVNGCKPQVTIHQCNFYYTHRWFTTTLHPMSALKGTELSLLQDGGGTANIPRLLAYKGYFCLRVRKADGGAAGPYIL